MNAWKKELLALKEILLNSFFPPAPTCPLCGRPVEVSWLCAQCAKEISSYRKQEFCRKCGKIVTRTKDLPQGDLHRLKAPYVGSEGQCSDCLHGATYPFQTARAVGPYQGLMKDTLYRLKYTGQQDLAQVMGMLMSELVMQDGRYREIAAVTFVPSTSQRLAARGFNQAELLAKKIAKVLGLPLVALLQRTKETPAQAKQGRRERQVQIQNAFQVVPDEKLVGKQILLVDDVFTTGSTVAECSRMLLLAGAIEVLIVTWATGVDKYI